MVFASKFEELRKNKEHKRQAFIYICSEVM